MARQTSIKKNLGFQTAYQILNTCLPLITAPYLSRVLGARQLGVYSYTSSIVAYFVLIAMLGTVNYGTRSIAAVKDNQIELDKTFWSIYCLQAAVSSVTLIAYVGYLIFVCKENQLISTIQIVAIIDCLFNINWLFFGLERFQLTVTRSFFIRLLTVALILILVKKQSDLWLYTAIMLGGTLGSDLVLWIYLPKTVSAHRIYVKDVLPHIKPNLILFIPLLAMSVYHTMDKTMLGLLSSYEQTGYYYNADKVINIPTGILTGIPAVLLPRMTSLITAGKKREGDKLFVLSLEGVVALSIAISFGIAAISKEFTPVFFGEGYDECIILIMVLSPVLIIKGFSITARNQYLIPCKLEKVLICSVISGAIINLFLNWMLIPKMGALGAVIGTLSAELFACAIQYRIMRKHIKLSLLYRNACFYLANGIGMFFVIRLVANIPISVYYKVIFEVIVGAAFYIIICCVFWKCTNNRMLKEVFGGTLGKLHIIIPD